MWYKKDYLENTDCARLYFKDPSYEEDLYLCIESVNNEIRLAIKKESSLLDGDGVFLVETVNGE